MTLLARVFTYAALALCAGLALAGCGLLGRGREAPPLEIVFDGIAEVSEKDLLRALAPFFADFGDSEHQKSIVDDWAYEIERAYAARGFPFAVVRYDYEESPEGRARASFHVTEGPRTRIEEARIDGAQTFSAEVLRSILVPQKKSLFKREPDLYVADRLDAGVTAIADFYRANGFLSAHVERAETTFDETRTRARVHVVVVEGVQSVLASLAIEGADPATETELSSLRRALLEKPYSLRTEREIRAHIETAHADRGFLDVRAERTQEERLPTGEVHLAFRVEPGPRVTISAIEIHGNDSTRDGFILARMDTQPGEIASRTRQDQGASRLYQSGLFESLRMDWIGEGESRALAIDVVEAPSLELSVEPGYGSYERARLSAGVVERNVFGTGRILSAEGSISALAESGKITWIDPYFVGSDVRTDVSVFANRREEPSFDQRELGTGVAFTKRWSRRFETSFGYQFRNSEISNVDPAAILEPDEVDDVDISSVLFSPTYDTRNNVFVPTRGSYSKATFELAGDAIGSELTFFRTRLSQASFLELDDDTALALSARTGWIIPFGQSETIPLQERFFNGGENTVRSFEEDELGPKDANGNPVGGEAWTVLSVELRRKLIGKLDGALFYDLGNVVPDHADYFDFAGFREGIGAGLRYELPVGPLRLDYAINPDPDGGESRDELHFSVGMAF